MAEYLVPRPQISSHPPPLSLGLTQRAEIVSRSVPQGCPQGPLVTCLLWWRAGSALAESALVNSTEQQSKKQTQRYSVHHYK